MENCFASKLLTLTIRMTRRTNAHWSSSKRTMSLLDHLHKPSINTNNKTSRLIALTRTTSSLRSTNIKWSWKRFQNLTNQTQLNCSQPWQKRAFDLTMNSWQKNLVAWVSSLIKSKTPVISWAAAQTDRSPPPLWFLTLKKDLKKKAYNRRLRIGKLWPKSWTRT